MNSLRGKIFFIILLSVLCIGGIGYYSITNLFELTNRVERLSQPNKKWELFRAITANLHNLNHLFYSQALHPNQGSDADYFSLIDSISSDINELRSFYADEIEESRIAELDTIPILLEQIKEEFQQLNDLHRSQQSEVVDDLEDELFSKLNDFSTTDSMHIVDRISLEVRSRNIPDSVFLFREEQEGEERRSFFRRLFSRAKPPETETKKIQTYKTITDTIVNTTTDTVLVEVPTPSVDEDRLSYVINEAFSNYHNSEVALLERLREREIKLYQRSSRITSDLEQLINELRFKENEQSRKQAELTVEYSKNFQDIIIWILVFFGVPGLLLVYMVSRDIRKNQQYQLEILENEEKAKREAVAKQEFLTTMSHELRTPLTSIIGYAELLDEDPKAKSIRSSSLHLLNVANEILDSAKIESGIIETKEEVFDLTDLLAQIQDSTAQIISDAGLESRFTLPDDAFYVLSDSYRIQQILYNLIHNAIKFTYKGYVGMEARVEAGVDDTCQVYIDVIDSGIGIHESNVDMIFENYQQIGTYKNKTQGIGLGLGLVKKVVKQLNGDINVTSKIGEGSTFHLNLTLKRAKRPKEADRSGLLEKDFFKGKHIYCIDDDPLITKLYRMILTEYGAEVSIENNPEQALEHLRTAGQNYALVITDIKMPNLTGHELLAQLKEKEARPSKIVASTANVLLNEQDKEELTQFDAYISKPILKMELLKIVAKTLGMKWRQIVYTPKENAIVVSKEQSFDIEDLVSFTMGDEEMLKEVLSNLYEENVKFLKTAMTFLAEGENKKMGEMIHKLSSRFAQIKVKEILPVKQLEKALLANENKLKEAEALLTYWSEVNHNFGTFMKDNYGEFPS